MARRTASNEQRYGFAAASLEPADFLPNLTTRPGVYRMLDGDDVVIYVGKARNLRSRVSSYFRASGQPPKTASMMRHARGLEVTVTRTETEALILEDTLIKKLKPRYNILLRDDKSYPFIHVSTDQDFPRVSFYRGRKKTKGRLFGPYPGAHAVRETVVHLQKLFRLRHCEDTFFAHRSRPCLQYQIERCSAPCVGFISRADYCRDVDNALLFLTGKSDQVTARLARRMDEAAETLEFEEAARLRDQIASLTAVQETQLVAGKDIDDLDVVATANEGDLHCVVVLVMRGGRSLGSRSYFPRAGRGSTPEEVLSAFLAQYYLARGAPAQIVIDRELADADLLATTFSERAGRKVELRWRVRGTRARLAELAKTNVRHSLEVRRASRSSLQEKFEGLRDGLELPATPQRMECFDISHTRGKETVASCVVFDTEGPRKADYRRFNIRGITPGDDYAAMRQALQRRYTRLKKGEAALPDLLVVDGGKGQLGEAETVLEELQVDGVTLLGVAKGPGRRPGKERLFLSGQTGALILPPDSPALLLIQQIRDEAHRFAIGAHRGRREKKTRTSVLESIHGLGPKRRRALLQHFGGLQGVSRAGVDDLIKVHGISAKLAREIYASFHSGA